MTYDSIYQPLPSPSERSKLGCHIRVLQLAPGSGEDPLTATLKVINIKSPERYEALSLAPGTSSPTAFLWLNHYAVPIQRNVEAALLSLRRADEPRSLWIDSICINHEDDEERTQQIRWKRRILMEADQVVAWIGTKTPGLDLAFDLARRLTSIRLAELQQKTAASLPNDEASRSFVRESILDGSSPQDLRYLREMLRRPYFTRCWSLEEVVANINVIFKSDELEIKFSRLGPSFVALSEASESRGPDAHLHIWAKIWDARELQVGSKFSDFRKPIGEVIQLLDAVRSFQVDDDRDKIFALSQLSEEGTNPVQAIASGVPPQSLWRRALRQVVKSFTGVGKVLESENGIAYVPAIRPNYSKSIIETYIDFARFMILRPPGGLDVLNYVVHNRDPDSDEYPTWVPKWFEPSDCTIMRGYFRAGIIKNKYPFAQIHDNPARGSPKNPFVLSADGFWVDNIDVVSDPLEFGTGVGSQSANVTAIERAWSQIFSFPLTPTSGKRYIDSLPIDIAFCQAVSAYPFGDSLGLGALDGMEISSTDKIVQQLMDCHIDEGRRARAFLDHVQQLREGDSSHRRNSSPHIQGDAARFLEGAVTYANSRRVFMTKGGRLGIGPKVMQPEDKIVVLFGGRLPFVVRRKKDGMCRLIGQCYIVDSRVMDGEVANEVVSKRPAPLMETFYFR